MFKAEATVGTAVTVDHAVEFDNESFDFNPTWIEPTGLRVGTKYKRASRLVQSRFTVAGGFQIQHPTKNVGTLWKQCLGSTITVPTLISGTAYKQVHQPGDFIGKSLTLQVGRPEPSTGTVRPFTYNGFKVTDWEFSVGDNEVATLTLNGDAWNETTATALATATYTAGASVFNFSQSTIFTLGGTPSTASGEVSIASGVAVTTVVKKFTIKGASPLATERYGLGNAGVKKEQLENDTPTITGTFDAEFDKATFYDVFKANTTTSLQLSLVGAQIAATGSFDTLAFTIAALKFKDAKPNVTGPDIVQASVDFEVYSDEINSPYQVKLISTDATL